MTDVLQPEPSASGPTEFSEPPEEILEYGDLMVDFGRHVITIAGAELDLSATEFDLLAYLAQATPHVVPAQELAERVQGYQGQTLHEANATLRYHFYRLRRKIKQAAGREDLIKTVHGVGYALVQPAKSESPAVNISFLYTDIQDRTALGEQFPSEIKTAVERLGAILRQQIETYGGTVFYRAGDVVCGAFRLPADAMSAALAIQRALHAVPAATLLPLRVRTCLHAGPAHERDGDYFGMTLKQLERLIGIGHGGQILLTGAIYEPLAGHLPEGVHLRDLGTRRLKGLEVPVHVFQLTAPDLPFQFPPLRTADARPSNLPAPLTRFMGREWETRHVIDLLRQPDVRLLTLTGVGGVGKTRLALHVATNLLDEYADGVVLVALATVREPDRVASAIARALGLESSTGQPEALRDALCAHLNTRQMLLLLDNFEQILDAAPLVTELLQNAPRLQVLATSREALFVYGEHNYVVPPLNTPDPRERIFPEQLAHYEATRLFLERARAVSPRLTPAEKDAQTIAVICACLEGLPLAIELAAARVLEFSLVEMASQLTSRLGFLSKGPRDFPVRHQTLRGMLEWSYRLLAPGEQALFSRLAVFVGGWTRQAAGEIAIGTGEGLPIESRSLDALAAKFLIQEAHGTPDAPRLTMLETVREFAVELFQASSEAETLRERHAVYYTHLLENAEPDLMGGARQKSVLWMCEMEQDNFRAALGWSLEHGQVEISLRMVKALWRFWGISSQLTEGRKWIEQILAVSAAAPAELRAPVLYGLGKLTMFQGDYPAAQRTAEAALELHRSIEDRDGMGWCLNALGEIASNRQDAALAERHFESGLELHHAVDNPLGIAKGLDDLGRLAMERGDYVRAANLLEESLRLRRERGSTEGIAVGLLALGEVLRLQGNYQKAESNTRESLARYRQLNHSAGTITALYNLAEMRRAQRDARQAVALYLEGLGLLRDLETEEHDLLLACLAGLALGLYAAGESYKAAQVLGVYRAAQMEEGNAVPEQPEPPGDHAVIRRGVGEAAWAQAMAEGESMDIEDLLRLVPKRK